MSWDCQDGGTNGTALFNRQKLDYYPGHLLKDSPAPEMTKHSGFLVLDKINYQNFKVITLKLKEVYQAIPLNFIEITPLHYR